jgi:hypothetical protein
MASYSNADCIDSSFPQSKELTTTSPITVSSLNSSVFVAISLKVWINHDGFIPLSGNMVSPIYEND